jgi:outer membrane protein assembly factor BamB
MRSPANVPARVCVAVAAVIALSAGAQVILAQARSAPDWTTHGADAQRTSWIRVDPFISLENMPKFQFLWKLKVDNESRHGNALTPPVTLGRLMTFRGFKSLIFVGGSSNNVYAIDYDFGTLFWRTHHTYAAGEREFAGSSRCPGGMTLPLTRATSLAPVTQLGFFGFARAPRPAKGDVGEPGRGAPQLAEIAARQAARSAARGIADTASPPAAAGARGAPPPSAAGSGSRATRAERPPNFVFSVAADGLLRSLIPDTGDLAAVPARFLPANATATGLIWANGFVYAATANTCGGAPTAVYAMDDLDDARPVITWDSGGAPIVGLSLGTDGTVYVATGTASGPSRYAHSIVALDGSTLKVKDWLTQDAAFTSTPMVFTEGERTFVAATSASRMYLLDAAALGGADHRTPLAVLSERADVRFGHENLSTWRDATGRRWLIASTAGHIASYRLSENSTTPALEHVWASRAIAAPKAPVVINGVVFAVSGQPDRNAVLFALDPATGKELWSSGDAITSPASAGLSAGTGQVFVVARDNTVWAFGIPLTIN